MPHGGASLALPHPAGLAWVLRGRRSFSCGMILGRCIMSTGPREDRKRCRRQVLTAGARVPWEGANYNHLGRQMPENPTDELELHDPSSNKAPSVRECRITCDNTHSLPGGLRLVRSDTSLSTQGDRTTPSRGMEETATARGRSCCGGGGPAAPQRPPAGAAPPGRGAAASKPGIVPQNIQGLQGRPQGEPLQRAQQHARVSASRQRELTRGLGICSALHCE